MRSDRHALLAIVESAYGNFDAFNASCRQILLAKLESKGMLAADEAAKAHKEMRRGLKYKVQVYPAES